ncbi:hypothetical protein Leryth_002107 [Lithospermum erythrorhizon]|nr:hypothetical protein Leryth_002107 [Lithospermum erythrorhizon]
MEEDSTSFIMDGKITGISFSLATRQEICKSSISDCPISHASQFSNPFLGLPLEGGGKCESCGTAEPGQCEGHFGYIELPIPIYHPDHISELKRLLDLICLKCLKMKNRKIPAKNISTLERVFSCCEEASQVKICESKTTDGACFLELRFPSNSRLPENCWTFLERYGFRYGKGHSRPLLPSEVDSILRRLPQASKRSLSAKGHHPQEGYVLRHLTVPPNCLSVPDISDGSSTMSSDYSMTLLKKVLRQVDIIKNSRSGIPNFESHKVETDDLQAAVAQYFEFRGTGKAARDVDSRFGVRKEQNESSTKAWLEKMKTLFIRKGSGFSSRSVITGDPYKGVGEIGLPFEIAQKITFEERVNQHNMEFLQKLVDEKLCLTFKDGSSTYSLSEGSKGHTFLRLGQVVHRKIMDGDIVFINRPPTTHKHSLQALSVYVHDDHVVKINPLICGPLSADFDGDCVHVFYPQSLAAKAEVIELFSVEKQLLSSHTGNFNLQLASDSLLSLKLMFRTYFFGRANTQQLSMYSPHLVPEPTLVKSGKSGCFWTVLQILKSAIPSSFDCSGDRHLIRKSEILSLEYNRDALPSILSDVVTSTYFGKGPKEVLTFFDSLQPLLMENLFSQGFSISLGDFFIPRTTRKKIFLGIQDLSPLLSHLRYKYNESTKLQLESLLRGLKLPVTNFVLKSSAVGYLIDSKSESALGKVVEQSAFLGLQISNKGKLYSSSLVGEMSALFQRKYPSTSRYPSEEYGFVSSCLFDGLDPYQEMVHSISCREVTVRSTRGLTEPGTLFKNLMAILRDVVICYDGTVRNVSSTSIVQFEYGFKDGNTFHSEFGAGDPVGVLAATAMSNPAYKAVLDSSASSNSSWEMMKEILLCSAKFKNDLSDRRVLLYLNDCDCGRDYCQERAACFLKNQLEKVSLKDVAVEFLIEYGEQETMGEISATEKGLVGHIHLNKSQLDNLGISMSGVLDKCEDNVDSFRRKKKLGQLFKRISLSFREYCSFGASKTQCPDMHCLSFSFQGVHDEHLERTCHILADTVCPVLLETIIKGDPRISSASIVWISPETTTWVRSLTEKQKGELVIDVAVEKESVKQGGDAWRVVMDCCLPVIDLIDTTRTIPYGIKQIQELLGISCAFEQAVQRLSSSVTMVTKGVLKDHLVLLANSMTCSGNMIGFNSGGIKAFSRALNIQAPFKEATLFTPRKCFEKAAENCHKDSLSSIVASCSWGNPVAVGTGTPFDIHWDTREVDLNQPEGVDVYSFLHLLRSTEDNGQIDSSCLGQDIDEFEMEDQPSPVRDSDFEKPDFEDRADFEDNTGNTSSPGAWNVEEKKDDHSTSWSSWEKKLEGNDGGQDIPGSTSSPGAWGVKEKKDDPSTSWGKKSNENEGHTDVTKSSSPGAWNVKERKDDQSASWSSWGKKNNEEKKLEDNEGGQVVTEKSSSPGAWNVEDAKGNQSSSWSLWGKKNNEEKNLEDNEGGQVVTGKSSSPGAWNVKETKDDQSSSWSSWGKKNNEEKRLEDNEGGQVVTGKSSSPGAWNVKETKDDQSASWEKVSSPGAGISRRKDDQSASWSSWGKRNNEEKKMEDNVGGQGVTGKSSSPGAWNVKEAKDDQSPSWSSWGKKNNEEAGKTTNESGSWSSWGKKSDDAGQLQETQATVSEASPNDWGKFDTPDEKESSTPNWRSNARGWQSSGDRRDNWRNRPPRSADPSSAVRAFTVTRQRLDAFTAEEQEIISEIEPIMQNIRRIMHQSGYTDCQPLTPEDQSYIIENVLNHHPDKAVKMGVGIDFIMVSKHANFQENRCLHVVSTDKSQQDFSYRKCLDNFIKEKYPEKAEEFLAKYFKKRQPQQPGFNKESGNPSGWNKDRRPPSGPGWNKDVGSPKGWNEESASPKGWNKEAGSPSGWKDSHGSSSGWKKEDKPSGWNDKPNTSSGWGKEQNTTSQTDNSSGWGKEQNTASQTGNSSGWGKERDTASQTGDSSGWGKEQNTPSQTDNFSGWGKEQNSLSQTDNASGWGKERNAPSQTDKSFGWGKEPNAPGGTSGWNKESDSPNVVSNEEPGIPSGSSSWNKDSDSTSGWNVKSDSPSGWEKEPTPPSGTSGWNNPPSAGEN